MVKKIEKNHVLEIISDSEITVTTVFERCTIVACKLPNDFVIIESSACVDKDGYDERVGYRICMNKIIDKVFELEGFRTLDNLYNEKFKESEWFEDYDIDVLCDEIDRRKNAHGIVLSPDDSMCEYACCDCPYLEDCLTDEEHYRGYDKYDFVYMEGE